MYLLGFVWDIVDAIDGRWIVMIKGIETYTCMLFPSSYLLLRLNLAITNGRDVNYGQAQTVEGTSVCDSPSTLS